jgi:hypothetical protein
LQAIAVLVEDEVHAALGMPGFLEKSAAGLFFLAGRRAGRNLFGPAKIDRLTADHIGRSSLLPRQIAMVPDYTIV